MRIDSPTTHGGRGPDAIGSKALLIPAAVMALTVAVFVSAILLMTADLKKRLYTGIIQQDGKVLQAATTAHLKGSLGDSEEDQIVALMRASTNDFGIRVFDPKGKWKTFSDFE